MSAAGLPASISDFGPSFALVVTPLHLSLRRQVPVAVLSARPAGPCRLAPLMDRRDDVPTMTYPTTASEQTYIEVATAGSPARPSAIAGHSCSITVVA